MRSRQLSFLPPAPIEHGGDATRRKRKTRRPFHPKKQIHITLRSSHARGIWSMIRPTHKWRIHGLLLKTSERHGIRIYRYANVGNHLHILAQAQTHSSFKAFLR